ncbi:hypothetical protein BOTBODRAFT_172711 [Botryobasidium botryosum FD-172 SS1]|uniref:SET domain-containing protein n=1 Tax=Botryobasidium botryosum (strain FD-172 SS1) TaxID=930990 RepID=A0A067N017_BOTB1|nr:hypothetical protein BOTBODRAFT_172711 [Botryobasidium botryosum FD-172 SS1]
MTATPRPPACKLTGTPEKGYAVRANRDIKRGELVIDEAPLYTLSKPWDVDAIKLKLEHLTREQKEQYLKLSSVSRNDMSQIESIFRSNCLPLGLSNPMRIQATTEFGIFHKISRFNSSCSPNVRNVWDEKVKRMRMVAQRDITTDEELCFSYGMVLAPRAQRMEGLKKDFGFECACAACARGEDASKKSDGRRAELARLMKVIRSMGHDPSEGVRMVRRALKLLKAERLTDHEDHLYYYGYLFCVGASDITHAKEWAVKALDALVLSVGPYGDGVELMRKYAEKPESHPCKGVFLPMTLSGPK